MGAMKKTVLLMSITILCFIVVGCGVNAHFGGYVNTRGPGWPDPAMCPYNRFYKVSKLNAKCHIYNIIDNNKALRKRGKVFGRWRKSLVIIGGRGGCCYE